MALLKLRSQMFSKLGGAIIPIILITWVNPIMAQESPLRIVTVTGEGSERIPSSLIEVNLGVEVQGKTAADVQKIAAQKTTDLIAFLRSRPVERLQTTGIRLQPNYNYQDNQQRLVGYSAINTVSFRLKTDQIGSLLDEAVQSGATRIDNISFTATEEAIALAQQAALRHATLNAQQQAAVVLKTLNLTPKDVIAIQIGDAPSPSPRPLPMMATAKSVAETATPVLGGDQTVRATVTLQIRY